MIKNQKAFTLLEVLLVIAILVILAGIVIIFIDPSSHLANTRNAKRKSDINAIYSATNQYLIDKGTIPTTIGTAPLEICRAGASSCTGMVDLSVLSNDGTYLLSMPIDPLSTSTYGTGYYIYKTSTNRPVVLASAAELGQVIEIGRYTDSSPPVIVSTPASHWAFNDASGCTALDSSDGNNGTLGPSCPTSSPSWTTGKVNGALSFNGVNNYVIINNAANLDPTAALTLSAWVKWNINPGTGNAWASLISKNGDNQYRVQHNVGNNTFEFGLRTTGCSKWIESVTAPVANVWYFITATYDGQYIKLYVNGNLESSNTCSGNILTSTTPLEIGGRSVYNDRYFDGLIDEVSIYSNALTAVEIQSLYIAGN